MPESNSFLLIDKPAGISSFDVIRILRKHTRIRSIGHSGTLDPFATGLLICATGKYTRMLGYLESEAKTYSAELLLGASTTTGDTEGDIQSEGPVPDTLDEPLLMDAILGLSELPTPKYSAVKIKGKPAYFYARKDMDIDLPPRPVKVSWFEVLNYKPPVLSYACTVSKGTYIRSLSEFIAGFLNTVGHTVGLRRTAISNIRVDLAKKLEEFSSTAWENLVADARALFSDREQLIPDPEMLLAIRNGQSVYHEGVENDSVFLFSEEGTLLGVAKRSDNMLFPKINLN